MFFSTLLVFKFWILGLVRLDLMFSIELVMGVGLRKLSGIKLGVFGDPIGVVFFTFRFCCANI